VAPMDRLTRWSMPLVSAGGLFLAMKGESARQELESAAQIIGRLGGVDPRVLSVGGEWVTPPVTVVSVHKLGATGQSRQSGRHPGAGR
jgi:16S rRNA (guanine527-N7)-methyltransferase